MMYRCVSRIVRFFQEQGRSDNIFFLNLVFIIYTFISFFNLRVLCFVRYRNRTIVVIIYYIFVGNRHRYRSINSRSVTHSYTYPAYLLELNLQWLLCIHTSYTIRIHNIFSFFIDLLIIIIIICASDANVIRIIFMDIRFRKTEENPINACRIENKNVIFAHNLWLYSSHFIVELLFFFFYFFYFFYSFSVNVT